MTKQQQARLGEIAVWVGTAQELLQQARSAQLASELWSLIPANGRQAIIDAAGSIDFAAAIILPLVQEVESE